MSRRSALALLHPLRRGRIPPPSVPPSASSVLSRLSSNTDADASSPSPCAADSPPSKVTLYSLFAGNKEQLRLAISTLADAILALPDPPDGDPEPVLLAHSFPSLILRSPEASERLLARLRSRPLLALSVFDSRRRLQGVPSPLPTEFRRAITLAGRAYDLDRAVALFRDATAATACVSHYNALMSAYMFNNMTSRCIDTFNALRSDSRGITPTIISYNIMLSVYNRSLLLDRMEALLQMLDEAGIARTIYTHNTIIAAYITAMMWDRMEQAFDEMSNGPIKPDTSTHLLMLRGYANSGQVEKMEKFYELVRQDAPNGIRHPEFIYMMVCAYCRSRSPKRIDRIEELMENLGEGDYRSWLNVLLIKVYAEEGLLEMMERLIVDAVHHKTTVTTVHVMRAVISSYFYRNALDRLIQFVQLAKEAGWLICRSLFHCKMVMYGHQNMMAEMHRVLDEMDSYNMQPNKKTFWILHKAYSNHGRRLEADTVLSLICKHGFEDPQCFTIR